MKRTAKALPLAHDMKIMQPLDEPYRPPRRLSRAVFLVAAPLAWLACVVAWLIMVGRDVRSVVVSGPIIFVFGLLVLIPAWRLRHRIGVATSATHMGIVVLFYALVNLLTWNPREAERPFLVMGALHLLLSAGLTIWAMCTTPRVWDSSACQRCGYSLRGLTSNRCPECGEPVFIPAEAAPVDQA